MTAKRDHFLIRRLRSSLQGILFRGIVESQYITRSWDWIWRPARSIEGLHSIVIEILCYHDCIPVKKQVRALWKRWSCGSQSKCFRGERIRLIITLKCGKAEWPSKYRDGNPQWRFDQNDSWFMKVSPLKTYCRHFLNCVAALSSWNNQFLAKLPNWFVLPIVFLKVLILPIMFVSPSPLLNQKILLRIFQNL